MTTRLLVQTALWLVFMAVLLFGPAGTVSWQAAWVFLFEIGGLGLAAGLWLARHDPGLLAERLSSPVQRAQLPWDRFSWHASCCSGVPGWRSCRSMPCGLAGQMSEIGCERSARLRYWCRSALA
jgi:hypothetical protein